MLDIGFMQSNRAAVTHEVLAMPDQHGHWQFALSKSISISKSKVNQRQTKGKRSKFVLEDPLWMLS